MENTKQQKCLSHGSFSDDFKIILYMSFGQNGYSEKTAATETKFDSQLLNLEKLNSLRICIFGLMSLSSLSL